MGIDYDEVDSMVDDCFKRQNKLSEWEINFIDSLSDFVDSKKVSDKQLDILEKIWSRIT